MPETLSPATLGPAMRLLSERRRRFVEILVSTGTSDETAAAREAGFLKDSQAGLRVQAYRLSHDPKILAAIKEECERRLRFDLPLYVSHMRSIAINPDHKHQRQALLTMMNIAGLRESNETVHRVELDPEHLKSQIQAMFTQLKGVDLQALLPSPVVIDHEPDPEP